MAKKGSFSKVYDKNGDYVDVEAARFDGTRTFQMQGDVSATQTWNGDSSSALTLNTSIGAKKVTTDKINDKAVGTAQLADDAVGLTQIDDNAMTSAATSGDDRLITSGGVRTEIDNAILNRGKDYGPMTPTQINAISETIPTGSTVHVTAAGTITDGDIEVRQGEDLKYYRGNGEHYWYSMDGDFKLKQQAKTSPTASGTALSFIDSITQDENGEISATKKTVQDGTTSQKGVVQLEDSYSSTSTTKAATPNSVKEAYDLANTANTDAVKNVAYDSTNKKITKTINGQTTDVVSAATLKTDMALNNVDNTSDANKPVSTAQQAALDLKLDKTGDGKDVTATFTEASTRANIGTGEKLSVIFGKIKKWFSDLGTAAFKNVPASGNASSTEVVLGSDTRLSAGASAVQDVTVDGASVVNSSTKVAAVPNASTSAKGVVQLAGSIGATVASENNKAATEKAVRDAVDTRLPIYNVDQTLTSLDFNDFTSTGFHYCGGFDEGFTSYSHAPMSLARSISWRLEVINRRGRVEQILVLVGDADLTAKNYKRHRSSGNVWSDWQTFVFESDLSSYEQVSNKVSAWQTTPDDTHYPSEKLVKDGLDAKAEANKVVAIADAQVVRSTATSNNWLKVISHTHTAVNTNIVGVWKISFVEEAASHIAYEATLIVNIRCNGSGQQPTIYNAFLKTESSYSLYSVCVEAIGVAGNVVANVYFNVPSYGAITIKCLSNGARDLSLDKTFWTYTSYGASATGVAKPVTDESTNTKVQDALVSKVQYNIANPTNNNLVAMDANGLVKDSGLTKASVESAITSAGSAIQGVKVNNTTLTPDANKVVNIPLATTSADGAMSAADKVALEGKVTGPSSATADNIAVFDGTTGKLIKNSGKKISDLALDSNVVHVRDCVIRRDNESGSGWFKAADISFRSYVENVTGLWHFSMATIGGLQDFDLIVNVRFNESGTTPIKYAFRVEGFRNLNTSNVTFKLVTRGLSGSSSTVVELWVFLKKDWVDVSISSLRNSGLHSESNQKWNYYNGSGGGSAAPTEDSQNNVYVYDPDITISKTMQTAVTDPTASGTALSFIDSITQNENGVISATKKSVAVDSTPTASSTNLVTSGGVKTALDGKTSTSNYTQVIGALGIQLRFLTNGYFYNGNFVTIINGYGGKEVRNITFGMRMSPGKTIEVGRFNNNVAAKEYSDASLFSVYSGLDPNNNNYSILLIVPNVAITGLLSFSVNSESSKWSVLYTAPSTTGLTQVTPTEYTNVFGASKGSASVPVYVDASGEATPCTDDFARDSEVVTSVQKETASSVTKLTYTKNGSKTDVLTFMDDTEAHSLWTNAKANAS